MKKYVFMNGNEKMFEFSHEYTSMGNHYELEELLVNEKKLPLSMQAYGYNSSSFFSWVESRVAPVGRHHMEAVLKAVNLKNKFDILSYCHGLSLNDTYWIKEIDNPVTFDEINLYDNSFDEALGWIAFTGLPSNISRNLSTPEFTTEGALPKYWQKMNSSNIILVKGGTAGYANAGGEPYSEVTASLIANILKINCINYELDNRNGKVVSISNLFTTKDLGLVTINDLLKYKFHGRDKVSLNETLNALKDLLGTLEPIYDMCFLDWLIKNDDRHLNNWGLLINNKTRKFSGFAPLWDNGMSLLWSAMKRDFPESYDYNNTFASFNIPYDFILECEYREKYIKMCNKLLKRINSGELLEMINPIYSYKDEDKHCWKAPYVVEMLKRRCEQYLK